MQILDHIARKHAKCTEFFTRDAAGFLMQEGAENGGFCGDKSLRKQGDNNASKNVSAASLCHAGICDGDDVDFSVGRGDVGGGAF